MRFHDPHGERANLTDYERRQFALIEHDLGDTAFDPAPSGRRIALRMPWRAVLVAAVLFAVLGLITASGALFFESAACAVVATVVVYLRRQRRSRPDR